MDKGRSPEVSLDPALIRPCTEVGARYGFTVALAGNRAPVILSGDILGRMRKVPREILKEGRSEGDDGVISSLHCEGNTDKAVSGVIDKATDINIASVTRGENEFSHNDSFRAELSHGTIAAAGVGSTGPGGDATPLPDGELPPHSSMPPRAGDAGVEGPARLSAPAERAGDMAA